MKEAKGRKGEIQKIIEKEIQKKKKNGGEEKKEDGTGSMKTYEKRFTMYIIKYIFLVCR